MLKMCRVDSNSVSYCAIEHGVHLIIARRHVINRYILRHDLFDVIKTVLDLLNLFGSTKLYIVLRRTTRQWLALSTQYGVYTDFIFMYFVDHYSVYMAYLPKSFFIE